MRFYPALFLLGMTTRPKNLFLQATLAEWQPQYGEPLTEEDARAITTNVASFFDTLKNWDSEALKTGPGSDAKRRESNGEQE